MRSRTGGLIAYYGLEDWWASRWSDDERKYLAWKWDTAPTLGADPSPLCTGRAPDAITRVGADHPGRLMFELGRSLTQPDEFDLARRLFADAERTLPVDDWFNRHFLYMAAGQVCYRRRDDTPDGLSLAIHYYSEQVAIEAKVREPMVRLLYAMPSHPGFKQLAVIHAASGEYAEAIALCDQARAGGWMGDWDKRIARYTAAEAKQHR